MSNTWLKRLHTIMITLILMVILLPGSLLPATERNYISFPDTKDHWALPAIERLSGYGIIKGDEVGFRPNDWVTRGEMAALIARVRGYQQEKNNPFSDLHIGDWYYEDIIKLAAAKIMVGYKGKVQPEANISREEAAVLISRAFSIDVQGDDQNPFTDTGLISSWAAEAVNGLHAAGYLTGKPDGSFDPKGNLTRGEATTIIANIISAFYNMEGEYSDDIKGNALIRAAGVTLQNMNIQGTLYMTEGIGWGDIFLNNVLVKNKTFIQGGGSNSIDVTGGDLGMVELDSHTNTHLRLSKNTKAKKITLHSSGSVTREGISFSFDHNSGTITLSGTIDEMIVNEEGRINLVIDGLLFEINLPEGKTLIAELTKDCIIKSLIIYAPLQITGTGQINQIAVHADGADLESSLHTNLSDIIVEAGFTISLRGKTYTGTGKSLGEQESNPDDWEDNTPPNLVTVTFHSNGGSEIAPIRLLSGTVLQALPMAVKENYAFAGWYANEELTNSFYSDVPIEKDIDLYAAYSKREGNMTVYTEPNKYIEECDSNITIKILSSVPLTENNLDEYVELTSYVAEIPNLYITNNGNVYSLSPLTSYFPGGLYEIVLKSTLLTFEGEDETIRKLTFRIHKEEVATVVFNNRIKDVLWSDVTDFGQGVYTVPADIYQIETGDLVRFWNGIYDKDIKYCNIVLATTISGKNGMVLLLNTEAGKLEDIFDELDIYINQAIPLEDYLDQIDSNKIARNAKNSLGARQLTAMLNTALAQSPTIQSLADGTFSYFDIPSQTEDKRDIPIGYLFDDIEDLEVICTVAGTDNVNFNPYNLNQEAIDNSKYGKDYSTVLTLTFKYSTVIKNKAKLDAEITIKEYLSASLQGGSSIKILKGNFEFDYAVNLYSQTDIFLSVLIKSVDESDEFKYEIDVTEEIEKLLGEEEKDEENDPAGILKKVLGDKGDYLTLVEANILDIPIQIIPAVPVAELHINLDFVIKVNFAAGISAKTTLLSSRQIGVAASTSQGYLKSYNNELYGNNRYAIDIYAAGYIGLKSGLKGSIAFSLFGFEDLGRVGASLEFGAYTDIYGFVHALILKTYPNDYIYNGIKKSEFSGAIYMELGLYLEIELFAESKLLKTSATASLLDKKFPLLSLGERYALSKYANNNQRILMNTESLPLKGNNGLLDAEFIDLTSGETCSGNLGNPSNFTILFSSPYFSVENNSIVVNKELVPANIKRINDVTAYIYYKGNTLTFTGPREVYYDGNGKASYYNSAKTVKLTWIDSEIDASNISDLETVKATYIINIDGQETTIDERRVLYAEIPGALDLFAYSQSHLITGYKNDYNAPIIKDTEYIIYMTPLQRLVSFITFFDDQWHFDVYAVNSGESPIIPEKYNTSQPALTFKKWLVNSGYWAYTHGNFYPEEIIPMNSAGVYGNANLFYGLDTTAPLYQLAGTLAECSNAYYNDKYKDETTFSFLCLARYDAQYQKSAFTVTIDYPQMEYSAAGVTIRQGSSIWNHTFYYGDPVIIPGSYEFAYYGCDMLGWDTNGDGVADYDEANPPIATKDLLFTAVMKLKTYEVTLQDYLGRFSEIITVNFGNLPPVLNTSPPFPGESSADLEYYFLGWEISTDQGVTFKKWDRINNPGVYEDWILKPIYATSYMVNIYFSADDDGTTLPSTTIVFLPPGTYSVLDYVVITPGKASDIRNSYVFAGWDCGESFTVPDTIEINALFTPIPINYILRFATPYGVLSTGENSHSFLSIYDDYVTAAASFISENNHLEDVLTPEKIYTYNGWSSPLINYQDHNITYTALWSSTDHFYAIIFDGGAGYIKDSSEKLLSYSYNYNTVAFLPMSDIFIKNEDTHYTYVLTGWQDETGNFFLAGAEYTVISNMTYTAVYEVLTEKIYTVTINANGGKFADDGVSKTFYGAYGNPTNITIDEPLRESLTPYDYIYTFKGWSINLPETFSENITIYALWEMIYKDYTITFNAGGGSFENNRKTIEQIYHYNDIVTPPEAPLRPGDELYIYTFYGWDYPLDPVTAEATYTAIYHAKLKDENAVTGITVFDGLNLEDISCKNANVLGYTFEYVSLGSDLIPVLTITENGLTISGQSHSVCIVIRDTCSSVTFDNLTLSSNYPSNDNILSVGDKSEILTSIYISGNCRLENYDNRTGTMRSNVPIMLKGIGENPSLDILSHGSYAIYNSTGMTIQDLRCTVEAVSEDPNEFSYVIFCEGIGKDLLWQFIDSDVEIKGWCPMAISGKVVVQGETYLTLESTSNEFSALYALELAFEDFTGLFRVFYSKNEVSPPALYIRDSIIFKIGENLINKEDLSNYFSITGKPDKYLEPESDPSDEYNWFYTFIDENVKPIYDVLILYLGD